MSGFAFFPPSFVLVNSSGRPYAGAVARFFRAGTNTGLTVYSTAALSTALGTSVTADSAGVFPPVFIDPEGGDYKVSFFTSGGSLIRTVDNIPATFPLTAAQVGAALYPQTSAEASAGVTPTAAGYAYPPLDVRRYGADDTGAVDSISAFNAAVSVAIQEGGGTVTCGQGKDYRIAGTITIGSRVMLDFGGSVLTQYTSNVPIISVTNASLNYQWAIRNGTLKYNTQQTTSETGAIGIRLATTNVTSYLGEIENVRVEGAYVGVGLPELTGCTAFLITMRRVWAYQCAFYGFDILGDTSGARTNMIFDACYVQQVSGSEISTSRGFRVKRVQELNMRACAADHIQNAPALSLETCIGASIDSFAAESCDLEESSGNHGWLTFSGCEAVVTVASLIDNTVVISGSAEAAALRTTSDSVVSVGVLYDSNSAVTDTSSGAYRTIYSEGSADRISVFSHRPSGTTPAASIIDLATVKKVRIFDGNTRADVRNGSSHIWASAAPTTEAWLAGDVTWNSAVGSGEPMGWICTSAGTPGTWEAFGQAGYRSGSATPAGSVTPHFIGEEYLDSTGGVWYKAKGATDSDWVALN